MTRYAEFPGTSTRHSRPNGVPGNFDKALKTYRDLKGLQQQGLTNLAVGIHTVVSRFNVAVIPKIVPELLALQPDSYITEIAENRVELKTMNLEITPEPAAYQTAIDFVTEQMRAYSFRNLGKIIRSFRLEYYEHVKSVLVGKATRWPCYAGFASAQIMPDGQVWACCIKGHSLGHLPRHVAGAADRGIAFGSLGMGCLIASLGAWLRSIARPTGSETVQRH